MNNISLAESVPVELWYQILEKAGESSHALGTIELVCILWKNIATQLLWSNLAKKHVSGFLYSHLSLKPYADKEKMHILSNWRKGKCQMGINTTLSLCPIISKCEKSVPSYFSGFGDVALYRKIEKNKAMWCTINEKKNLNYKDLVHETQLNVKTEHKNKPTTLIYGDNLFVSRSSDSIQVYELQEDVIKKRLSIEFQNHNKTLFLINHYALSIGDKLACAIDLKTLSATCFETPQLAEILHHSRNFKFDIRDGKCAILHKTRSQKELCLITYDLDGGKKLVDKRWSPLTGQGACPSFLQIFENVVIAVINFDFTLYIWDVFTGVCVYQYSSRRWPISDVSLDGTKIRARIGNEWIFFDFASGVKKRAEISASQ